MNKVELKKKRLVRRKLRIKRKIRANTEKMRLCLTKTNKHLYAQIIDDSKSHTVVSASTTEKDFSLKNKTNIEAAKMLGKTLAEKALQKGIKGVVFDRNGALYHGKVKAFADASRENGLEF